MERCHRFDNDQNLKFTNVVNRKWPYRALAKIDKEIATIMHNIPKNADGSLDPEVEQQLAVLLRKRQMEARTVIIRLN